MLQPADWQDAFAKALLNPEEATLPRLQDPYGGPTLKRFAIYRNNVVAGLIDAIKASFPVVCRIVGEEFFKAMARVYAVQHPPQSPVLLEYGENFATFIDNFGPAASLPYLGDVARIERAWLEAYHAPEASPLSPSTLASIPPAELSGVRFHLHPSLRLVCSRLPAFTIWRTNVESVTPTPVDLQAGGENVLVSRRAADVEIRTVSDGGMSFLRSIADGKPVIEATRIVLAFDSSFDLSTMLAGMLESGCFVACQNDCALVANYGGGQDGA
jgi:hypothetical protein